MARKGGSGRKSKSNGILATATVSGGVGGVVAMALAVWTILSWYDMNCSFDKNCTFPMSSKDKEDETYYMNVKFIMAWFVAGPAFIAILLGLIAALM